MKEDIYLKMSISMAKMIVKLLEDNKKLQETIDISCHYSVSKSQFTKVKHLEENNVMLSEIILNWSEKS